MMPDQEPAAPPPRPLSAAQLEPPPPPQARDVVEAVEHYAPLVGLVIVILLGAWLVAARMRRIVRGALLRTRFDPTLGKFISNLLKWVILLFAVLVCLDLFGVTTTGLAAILGAAILAIGLGFQGSLSHFAAGIMLLIFRPFKVGDFVNIAGQLGRVNEIDLFFTELDTPDGRRLVIPNSQILGQSIENITHHPRRRVEVPVGVHYEADIDATRAALEHALTVIEPRLDDPAPEAILQELGASSVNWQLRVWTKREDFFATRQATVRAAKMALEEAGITIPFPQMDVHLRFPEGAGAAAMAQR